MNKEKLDQDLNYRFSDDRDENLRIENELLKMEMESTYGGSFGIADDVPPEVEHAFLQQVRDLEEDAQSFRQVRLYELLGQPQYVNESELSDKEVEERLAKLYELLESVNVYLSVLSYQSPRTLYRFITEELFEVEVREIDGLPISQLFIYEDFHPDHAHDVQAKCIDFLTAFWESDELMLSTCLSKGSYLAGKGPFNRDEMTGLLESIREVLSEFEHFQFSFDTVVFDWDEEKGTGSATASGDIEYQRVLQEPSQENLSGSFLFQLQSSGEGWNISQISLPVPRL